MSVTPGAIRFNTDSMKLEYYRGGPVGFGTTTTTGEWVQITTDTPDIQTGGTRGLFAGGYAGAASAPKTTSNIDYVNIASTGNAVSFGSLSFGADQDMVPVGASRTRGVFRKGGATTMEYVTFASTGNSVSFGTALASSNRANGLSNETRGIYGGGGDAASKVNIDYITIA